ncbi:MAG: septal ring lytic transglycosylase RlpA family protein [Chloroflexaceae bacterium]|nr:septal ring lytic transglycosylase RlpA family protein [Chloroflexaceae bacterium]
MKQKLWRGITTALMTTALGAAVALPKLSARAVSSNGTPATGAAVQLSGAASTRRPAAPSATPAKQQENSLPGDFRVIEDSHPLTAPAKPNSPRSLSAQTKGGPSSGMASWYGPGFHGRRTASGEVFNQNAMTAAHRTLPFGTQVRVTNVRTGQAVIVRINDRGPHARGRAIDLSTAAARAIGLVRSGVAPVRIEILGR